MAELKTPHVSSLPFWSLPGVQRCWVCSSATQCSEERLFRRIHTTTVLKTQWLNRGTGLFDPFLGRGLCWMQKELENLRWKMENRNERQNLWSSKFWGKRSNYLSTTGWFSPMTLFPSAQGLSFCQYSEFSLSYYKPTSLNQGSNLGLFLCSHSSKS